MSRLVQSRVVVFTHTHTLSVTFAVVRARRRPHPRRAEVGRLTRNVIIQGDDNSKREQFGVQVVLSSDGDESLIGRLSNVETRFTGQGLKLGKYPLHFHLVGAVSKSYIANCSVHHTNNRAIAVHGIQQLRVLNNVLLDVRGHALFLEVTLTLSHSHTCTLSWYGDLSWNVGSTDGRTFTLLPSNGHARFLPRDSADRTAPRRAT